jgi:UV damage endonuclease UvdE
MFNNSVRRLGFACKLIDYPSQMDSIKPKDECKQYNTGTTTVAWLNRQSVSVAEDKLWDLMKSNIESLRKLVTKVGSFEPHLRMVRLSSEVLPVYTEPKWGYFYKQSDVIRYAERHFAEVGRIARERDVRLSFHPGQFCCIVSENEGIVQNSLEELEYHTDMMRWMGYGNSLLDAKINIHLSGKRAVSGFDSAWNRMSPELRNMLTLENDEFQAGLDVVLKLKHKAGIVLDLHHHWINTGEYIEADDSRIQMVIESWCRSGIDRRPTFHYSQSHESVLGEHPHDAIPSISALIELGHKKAKLRAHSNGMWNIAVNKWARQHWEWGDCMVESKLKNLASNDLYSQWTLNS